MTYARFSGVVAKDAGDAISFCNAHYLAEPGRWKSRSVTEEIDVMNARSTGKWTVGYRLKEDDE